MANVVGREEETGRVASIAVAYAFGPPLDLLSCRVASRNVQMILGMVTGLALFWSIPGDFIFRRRGRG